MAKSWLEGGPETELAEPSDLSFGVTSATPSRDGQVVTLADRASNSVTLNKQFEEMDTSPLDVTWMDQMNRWDFPDTVEYEMEEYRRVSVVSDVATYRKQGGQTRSLTVDYTEDYGDGHMYVQLVDGSTGETWEVEATEETPGQWSVSISDDSAGLLFVYTGPLESGGSYEFTAIDQEERTVELHRIWSGASAATIQFPRAVPGRTRQFILRVSSSCESGELPTLTFAPKDSGNQDVSLEDGAEMPSFGSGVTVVRFTETAPGKFVPERLLPVVASGGGSGGGSGVGSVFMVMGYDDMEAGLNVKIGTITAVNGATLTVNIDPSVVNGFDENPVEFDLDTPMASTGMFQDSGDYMTPIGEWERVYLWEWSGMGSDFSGGIVFRLNS